MEAYSNSVPEDRLEHHNRRNGSGSVMIVTRGRQAVAVRRALKAIRVYGSRAQVARGRSAKVRWGPRHF